MNVSSRSNGNTLYIYLDGEIDESAVKALRKEVDERLMENTFCDVVVFNLAGVRFMDSTGIGFLIGRYKKIKSMNMTMCLENPNLSADKVLSVSGIYSIIPKIM